MNLSFSKWYAEHKAVFDMEQMIINDKLKQGIDGIEWLVLQTDVNESMQYSLNRWLHHVTRFERLDVMVVMKDTLTMDSDSFYTKYCLNWWISIEETLTHLCLMRQSDYEKYFSFLMTLKGVDKHAGTNNQISRSCTGSK